MRRSGTSALALGAALVVAGVLSACGTPPHDQVRGAVLTVYASAPLDGASAQDGISVLQAERLALAQRGSRIGRYRIILRNLDDSTPQRGEWDPAQTTADARTAAADPTTVGYLGELNSGASAVSIPILNRADIGQISPWSSAVGLTSSGPGASPGEPLKYYPTGVRTFARVVPNDEVQASVQVQLLRSLGCARTYVLQDGEVDGSDAATSFSLAAQRLGFPVLAVQQFDRQATGYTSLTAAVAQSGATCALISAVTAPGPVLLTRQLAATLPGLKIIASAGLAASTYVDPRQGGLPIALDPRLLLTAPASEPGLDPAARKFLADYRRRYGTPEPDAVFGYQAMSLLLDAISRATRDGRRPARRSEVRAAMFSPRRHSGALGTYTIDSAGDTNLRRYGVYRVVRGRLVLWRTIVG
ncbi:MAG: branched-chain amino acid ABC transporter substrate-binding protein [Solirubrobacteraceae bacterium]